MNNLFSFSYSVSLLFLLMQNFSSAGNSILASDKNNIVSNLQKQVDILHYHLKFDLNPTDKILSGTAVITAVKIQNQNSISSSIINHDNKL